MADNRMYGLLAVLGVGVAAWYVWANGGTHTTHQQDPAWSPISFNPYAWWQGHGGRGEAYVHHYPQTVAPGTLKTPLANEEGTLSVARSEAGNG